MPISARLRHGSSCCLGGDPSGLEEALSSPLFGLPKAGSIKALQPILEWLLKGSSPGYTEATYCEDIVLAGFGKAALDLSAAGRPVPLTRLLVTMSEAIRETVIGQFLTTVQGAKAMERVRKGKEHAWQERKQLDAVAQLMVGQVRTALAGAPDGLLRVGGREIVTILTPAGEERMISLRQPSPGDWKVLDLARHPKGEKDTAREHWMTLSMMILCAAQAEAGWFDLVRMSMDDAGKMRPGGLGVNDRRSFRRRSPKGKAHGVVLSEEASEAIKGDLTRWLQLGFIKEPMVVPPEEGDYLSVKHRSVLGARGPKGIKTDAQGSAAWHYACTVMATTGWTINGATLEGCSRQGDALSVAASLDEPDAGRRAFVLGSYARLSAALGKDEPFYFPIRMDFRGRIYLQTPFVTYQGKDLQKGLLCFPSGEASVGGDGQEALAWEHRPKASPTRVPAPMPGYVSDIILPLHLGALYGGPDKLDKAPLPLRREWLRGVLEARELFRGDMLDRADEPVQLATALDLLSRGEWDRIPCQIDGTCNGLQHLSALFRDETAATAVNLGSADYGSSPSDIYGAVASRVLARVAGIREGWSDRLRACVRIDRVLCKKPVMVLPYGGQKATIEDACLSAILEQYHADPSRFTSPGGLCPWRELLRPGPEGDLRPWQRDQEALAGDYLAFRERDLENHPLLHLDAKRLGTQVWECIEEQLPRPIAAMAFFRALARAVGSRTLEWSTGFSTSASAALWVVQARAKSQRSTLKFKGLHLPGSIRGLAIRQGRDEVDAAAHTSGIVANFIHSHDADHLARTMKMFVDAGGRDFGAIHDCFITRPSQMPLLQRAARYAFHEKYATDPSGPHGCGRHHPLVQPVRLREVQTGQVEEFSSWFALAEHFAVVPPEMGCWDPQDVLQSAWFFS